MNASIHFLDSNSMINRLMLRSLTLVGFLMTFVLFISPINTQAQQLAIERIEQMPTFPQPYVMRDWKTVALQYDSLVFDFNASGQYLPLIWMDHNTVNYPEHRRFGLASYVGGYAEKPAEAINILPAIIGATLCGVDKSDQNGMNLVLMAEEFFNRRPEENIYLNGFIASSGSDWWYETMPNVFFYQLYDLYPGTGDFDWQFTTIADRMLEAVESMGGSSTPWKKPYMNYRAWSFSTMTPLLSGVRQPEAAGAIAWILYHAFRQTGDPRYRIGAEWAMEFLSDWTINPSYELQLPYGVYTAARMNAELGTVYDVPKLLNWCFTPAGNVRNWGATLGNWGGYDCDGLIGEAAYEGYAFTMNGFQQIFALLPMLRYDDRFARTLGKWILNCANASRLFYSAYLPDQNQDGEDWARQYDLNSSIAHEAMREKLTSISPYATGDALNGGWAATNFALYGSSHVGMLGAILDTTNITGILKLDVGRADFYAPPSYPTFLYYNPHGQDKTVALDVGLQSTDLYDVVSNQFIAYAISGVDSFTIPGDGARLLVLVPSGASVRYEDDRTLADEVIIDYQSGRMVENYPPRIKSLTSRAGQISKNGTVTIYSTAMDRDGDSLTYQWQASGGTLDDGATSKKWTAPDVPGIYEIRCIVSDDQLAADSAQVVIEVLNNQAPQIQDMRINKAEIDALETVEVQCLASDPDNDELVYRWRSTAGSFSNEGMGNLLQWQAADTCGYFYLVCEVQDSLGGLAVDSIGVSVGRLVLHIRGTGSAVDSSCFDNSIMVHGAVLTDDHSGNPQSAFYFDGLDDHIQVTNAPWLNFETAISVACWMRVDQFFEREAYPLSHGNWENRWKISITNQGIRWTVKSDRGIKDLDSSTKLETGQFYHAVAVYDGSNFLIYMNGQQDAASTFSGKILKTSFDLTIGQVLPNNNQYNFQGVLEDIRVYNRALSAMEVSNLYHFGTSVEKLQPGMIPTQPALNQNYPNPFNDQTVIPFQLTHFGQTEVDVFDVTGRKVMHLFSDELPAGFYTISWDAQHLPSGLYFIRLRTLNLMQTRKCIKLN
jgi:hypothetical protein